MLGRIVEPISGMDADDMPTVSPDGVVSFRMPTPPASAQPKKLSFSAAAAPSPMAASAAAIMAAIEEESESPVPAAHIHSHGQALPPILELPSLPTEAARDSMASDDRAGKEETKDVGEGMQVFLRVRPLHEHERAHAAAHGHEPAIMLENNTTVRVAAPESSQAFKNGDRGGTFTFSRVFGETVGQAELFDNVMSAPAVSAVHEGKSSHIFAYGMTNAGKTFTITGTDEQPGVLPRTLASVFRQINALGSPTAPRPASSRLPTTITSNDVFVLVSYLEIYNEQCYDLLATGNVGTVPAAPAASFAGSLRGGTSAPNDFVRPALPIKDGRDGRAYVRNLRHVTVKSTQAALELMKEGATNKRMAETAMNADSSRSHTVFTISIFIRAPTAGASEDEAVCGDALLQEIVNPSTGQVAQGYRLWSRVSVVDLAGSERQTRTMSSGARLKEAARINNSLMVLMQCFEAMRWNATHPEAKRLVPFRETKLTRLFADSLGGLSTGTTIMIVNAGPAAADFDETLHALKYGALAKDIKIIKDRIVTRWEPSQYADNGRRLQPGGSKKRSEAGSDIEIDADAETAGTEAVPAAIAAAKVNPPAAKSVGIAVGKAARRPHAPPPIHGPQPAAGKTQNAASSSAASLGIAAAPPSKQPKHSIASTCSQSSYISTSLIDAALAGEVPAPPPKPPSHRSNGANELPPRAEGARLTRAESTRSLALSSAVTVEHDSDVEDDVDDAPPAVDDGSWQAQREELVAQLSALQHEVAVLQEALEDAQDSAAAVEADVRDEVAQEMADRLTAVEEEYRQRMAAEAARFEERITKLIKLQELRSQGAGPTKPAALGKRGRAVPASDDEGTHTGDDADDVEIVAAGTATGPRKRPAMQRGAAQMGARLSGVAGPSQRPSHGRTTLGSKASLRAPRSMRTSTFSTASITSELEDDEAMNDADGKIEELQAQVAECEAEIDRLTQRYQQDTELLQSQLDDAKAAMAQLQTEHKKLQESFSEAEETLEEQAHEIQHLVAELNAQQRMTEDLCLHNPDESPSSRTKREADATRARIVELEAQSSWLQRELERAHRSAKDAEAVAQEAAERRAKDAVDAERTRALKAVERANEEHSAAVQAMQASLHARLREIEAKLAARDEEVARLQLELQHAQRNASPGKRGVANISDENDGAGILAEDAAKPTKKAREAATAKVDDVPRVLGATNAQPSAEEAPTVAAKQPARATKRVVRASTATRASGAAIVKSPPVHSKREHATAAPTAAVADAAQTVDIASPTAPVAPAGPTRARTGVNTKVGPAASTATAKATLPTRTPIALRLRSRAGAK